MKLRARSRTRGAAMVEAAFVMPVLIACWMAGVYAQKAVVAKLDTIANSRGTAWGYASANCGAAGDPASPSPAAVVNGGTKGTSGQTSPSDMVSGMGGGGAMSMIMKFASALMPPFPTGGGTDTQQAGLSSQNGTIHYASTHKTSMKVACNEAPQEGSVAGVIKDVWSML